MLSKRIQFWIALAALVLVTVVLLLIFLSPSREPPAPAAVSTTQAPYSEPTETPTLPPPEANPYGPSDFWYDGPYLTCGDETCLLGIDVSDHQSDAIDWAAVKEAGIEFVMIRVGYRGYETGELHADDHAQLYYQGAKDAGLQVGAYFFSQAVNTAEAMEEAEFALAAVEDWQLDLPLAYDWEFIAESARTGQVDRRTLTDCVLTFCGAVEAAGRQTMVYFNQDQAYNRLFLRELTDYGFWLAMYSSRMTYPYRLNMWQYSATGAVPGIEGNVDLDLYFPAQ